MSGMLALFLVLIFTAVFLLVQGLVVPAFGESGRARKALQIRLREIQRDSGQGSYVSILRQSYLDSLSPGQRRLEELPGMARLRTVIEQAGLMTPAWQVLSMSIVAGLLAGCVLLVMRQGPLLALVGVLIGAAAPVARVFLLRRKRLEQFEVELPDAVDMIKRALRAGQPFASAIKLVGDDLEGPVGKEFRTTSADISYGNDSRRAMLGLLARVPSVALMGFVTAVLLQRETGGNLAEILEQISGVIRGRFRFQRRVRTLSAEGRMSAWVLTMVPIVLSGILMVTSPDYLPKLFESPDGQKMLVGVAALMIAGILWMRRIIRIEY